MKKCDAMYVIKADGRKEEFSGEKIIKTCMRAGVSEDTAREIAETARDRFRSGTTTHEIYRFILDELDKAGDRTLFALRESVARLDPTSFELYVKKILEAHGYRCVWNKLIEGKYVEHQIDIIASRDKNFLVECKRHFNPHRFTGLGICLQVEARLRDVVAGAKAGKNSSRVNAAWIVTNTKFSDHAKQYARGVGVRLSGWKYEEKYSLESLIETKKVLPVTMLTAAPAVYKQLLQKNVITLYDLLETKPRIANIKDLAVQARDVLNKL